MKTKICVAAITMVLFQALSVQAGGLPLISFIPETSDIIPITDSETLIDTSPGSARTDLQLGLYKRRLDLRLPDIISTSRSPRSLDLGGVLYNASLTTMIGLNIADYLSTRKALRYPCMTEGNPFMKPFVKNEMAFAAVKLALTAGNHFLMQRLYKQNKTLAWLASITGNLVMTYVVMHNHRMLRNIQGR